MVRDNNPVSAGAGVLGSIAARAVHAVTERVQSLVLTGDLDARDTDYIREGLPGLWLLASRYFRADVQGLHHIPREGTVLLVGNHLWWDHHAGHLCVHAGVQYLLRSRTALLPARAQLGGQ